MNKTFLILHIPNIYKIMSKSLITRKFNFLLFLLPVLMLFSCADSRQEVDYRKDFSSGIKSEYPNKEITDGPYVFQENGETILKWIAGNEVISEKITDKNFGLFKENFGLELKPEWLQQDNKQVDYQQKFENVDRFIALSDIHGQHKLFIKILRENDIIDEAHNWSFGSGHLVIVGDIFDRGPQVNESLWLVFKLAHQAIEAGGHLHYTIGNHEEMVINKDHRYVNEKYFSSAKKMGLSYEQLFGENTVIGKWLRTNPVILQINDVLLVHAGVSPELVQKGFTAEQINKLFLNEILGKTKEETAHDSVLTFLRGHNGPIWYRGYFRDDNLDRKQVDQILNYFNVNYIVVGHTSQESIVSLFRNKIFGIDSSIKNGKYGEILIYDKGDFFRGTIKLTPAYTNQHDSN